MTEKRKHCWHSTSYETRALSGHGRFGGTVDVIVMPDEEGCESEDTIFTPGCGGWSEDSRVKISDRLARTSRLNRNTAKGPNE